VLRGGIFVFGRRAVVQRARYTDANLVLGDEHIPAVVEICRKLNGIPLAIELAAARLPTIGLETLRAGLTEAFALSGGRDLPARQQTMTATISWSFDLLSDPERRLLERISIFTGGFTLDAAESVRSGDGVPAEAVADLTMRLVDKSLLNVADAGERTRNTLLDSIRTFGLGRLHGSGETWAVARRHAQWLAFHATAINSQFLASPILVWLPEIDNARSAIEWCLESDQQADIELAAQIASGLRRIWIATNRCLVLYSRSGELLKKLDDREHNYRIIANLESLLASSFAATP
jgi:predicted ATPase